MIEFAVNSADGTQLIGQHWPAEEPKAVMALVHGFGEHCGRYAPMAAHLNSHDIAVVALDFRGHGKSAGPRGVVRSYEDFHADLAALLAQTQTFYPDAPQILYGHSMGGGLVLDHGTRNLDDLPIIASAPFITLANPVPTILRVVVQFLAKLMPKGAMSQPIDGTKISNLTEEQSRYIEDPLNHGKLGFRLAQAMVETGERLTRDAENWNRPLLLFHSKADQLTGFSGSEAFSQAAQKTEFHAFETHQHEMHNDMSRAEVYTLMSDFILKHAS